MWIKVILFCAILLDSKLLSGASEVMIKSHLEDVTISKMDYCDGCKETVNLFSRVAFSELESRKNDHSKGDTLVAESLVDRICDHESISHLSDSIKYACVKIMDDPDSRITLLQMFEGSTSAPGIMTKGELFRKKKEICVTELKACPNKVFSRANIAPAQQSKCRACHIIASDIDRLGKILGADARLVDTLEDGFCDNMGSNHQPYRWIEDICDEMVEEKIDDIVGVVAFHAKVARTGFTPSETMSDMMCKEFYKCPTSTDGEL